MMVFFFVLEKHFIFLNKVSCVSTKENTIVSMSFRLNVELLLKWKLEGRAPSKSATFLFVCLFVVVAVYNLFFCLGPNVVW